MKASESITNDLLNELESLTYRLRSIKQCFDASSNKSLRKRLFEENISLIVRVNEIYKLGELLLSGSTEKMNYSSLLVEKSRRTLKEIKKESNLFFL